MPGQPFVFKITSFFINSGLHFRSSQTLFLLFISLPFFCIIILPLVFCFTYIVHLYGISNSKYANSTTNLIFLLMLLFPSQLLLCYAELSFARVIILILRLGYFLMMHYGYIEI